MKHINTILFLFITLLSTTIYAQNPLDPGWLWAERGGSGGSFNYLSDAEHERIVDIVVDANNNYYYLAEVGGYTFTIGDMEFETYNDLAQYRDILVFSTDDQGNYRWSKIIGGGWDDIGASSIGVDENNNVYVSGSTININGNTPVHFDTDSVMNESTWELSPSNKRAFMIKYDSEGNFQWLNQPEGDEVPLGGSASWAKTVTEPNGHTHSLVWFWAGEHLDGQLIVEPDSSKAIILNYNEHGDLLNFIPLNMSPEITAPYNYQLAYDPNLDRYYIGDTKRNYTDTISINGYGVESGNTGFYLAAVDNEGEVIWFHENNNADVGTAIGDVKIDSDGNIYFTGFFNVTVNSDSFAGYEFEATGSGSGKLDPFLIKLNSNGNLIWGTNADLYSRFPGQSIVVDGNNVYLGLGMLENIWDGVSIPAPSGQGLVPDIQIIRFDAQTGMAQEAISNNETTPTRDAIMAMALDTAGALVVGGYFGSTLFGGTDLQIQNTGPDSDFFIAKYQPQDTGVGINEVTALKTINVYPNPTNGVLNLQSQVALTSYTLCDLQGRVVKQGNIEYNQVDLSGLESGVYVLGVRGGNGGVRNFKVLKE